MNYLANVNYRVHGMTFNCTCTECGKSFEKYISKDSIERSLFCEECSKLPDEIPTQALMKKFFFYNPRTGELICRLPIYQKNIGEVFGHPNTDGYLVGNIGSKSYLVHRLIWLYVYGYLPNQIDHIDHNKANNRITNLRDVSNTENQKNCSVSKNSSTGVNGVSLHKPTGKYRAYVMVNKKQIHLGLFETLDEAKQARKNADLQYNFHQNHGK
nr:MAG TPA: endonuclease [Caudoviricetes sp.]